MQVALSFQRDAVCALTGSAAAKRYLMVAGTQGHLSRHTTPQPCAPRLRKKLGSGEVFCWGLGAEESPGIS